ncbi:MAG: hypoxanthine phosphoribosyltransferase [Myxococcota bacterium]
MQSSRRFSCTFLLFLVIGCASTPRVPVQHVVDTTPAPRLQHVWHEHMQEVLFTQQQLAKRVREMGQEISQDLAVSSAKFSKPPLFLSVLTGSFMFTADLLREIQVPHEVKFIRASSYGSQTQSSGQVSLSVPHLTAQDVLGRTVIIVEDIVDTGRTIHRIQAFLRGLGATNVQVCTLLSKPSRRVVDVAMDYVGFEVEDQFVVGYGLDFDKRYRSLKYIGVLKPQLYVDR